MLDAIFYSFGSLGWLLRCSWRVHLDHLVGIIKGNLRGHLMVMIEVGSEGVTTAEK